MIRDIAARNVLIDLDKGGLPKAKLTDFGRALELTEEKITIPFSSAPFRILSPEVLESAEYSFAADVWYGK